MRGGARICTRAAAAALRPALLALLALLPASLAQETTPEPAGSAVALRIGMILPDAGGAGPGAILQSAAAEAARTGAVMAEEELGFNAEILGMELDVLFASAPDAEAAAAEAARLVDEEGATALVGGYGEAQALAVARVAEEHGVPFLNVGSPSDRLRGEACLPTSFHVEPSAAMYLDALAGWFVRAGFRDWFVVLPDSDEGRARAERFAATLRERHFGARQVDRVVVDPSAAPDAFDDALAAVRRARPDVVLLLLDAADQLAFLEAYEDAGLAADLDAEVTGFPEPAAQTRAFLAASREAAPEAGAGFRASAWEATLDAYGARELNARYGARWGEPMDAPAWAAYQAVKILFESASFGGSAEGSALVEHLAGPAAVFDVWKGIGVTFRPWDHQLRQSLYLVDVRSDPGDGGLATLVGELPAIYMPRTDPVERLDQLGDLDDRSACRF